jgi:hypothetical protein
VKLTLPPAPQVKDGPVPDGWLATIDAVAEADRAAGRTNEAVLDAGQAAVDALNARRGKPGCER